MTAPTVTHSGLSAPVLTSSERRAFERLVEASQTPRFDLSALLAVRDSYPAPRTTGQAFLSGTTGRDERYTRTPARRLIVKGEEIGPGRADVDLLIPASVSVSHQVERGSGLGVRAGLTMQLHLMPGAVSLSVHDEVRRQATAERLLASRAPSVDLMVAPVPFGPVTAAAEALWDPERVPSRVITEWSPKSRSRMLKAFMAVDWSALDTHDCPLAMVTLTYPGDWERCTPTGRHAKRHLRAFRQAFYRAIGWRLDGAWKQEFQDRGAPHFHLLMPVPAVTLDGEKFEHWLSRTWARIVDRSLSKTDRLAHREEGHYGRHISAGTGVDFSKVGRMSDPKRLAVYFYKHGTKSADGKEYQHRVPRQWLVDEHGEVNPEAGPGRFWGFWGMDAIDVVLDLDPEDFTVARRYLRKVAAARTRATAYSRARHVLPARIAMHPAKVRKMIGTKSHKSRVLTRGRMQGGFVIVNDGPALAAQLSRALNQRRMMETP